MNIDINYSATNAIGGYQFQVEGVTLTGVTDGPFDVVTFNPANGMVIGFSTSGANLPDGDGTLIHLMMVQTMKVMVSVMMVIQMV